jgi:16S rRNA processing protein RimM
VTAVPAFSDLMVIGRFARPQGRHGELVTEPLSDRPERFTTLDRVFVESQDGTAREEHVTAVWPHKGRYVLKLAGIDSIEAAERLRGRRLALCEAQIPPLPCGSYYHHQLRGLRVFDEGGVELGVVADLWETGAPLILVVRGGEGDVERLLPFAEPFIVAVQPEQGRLVVRLLETVDAGS